MRNFFLFLVLFLVSCDNEPKDITDQHPKMVERGDEIIKLSFDTLSKKIKGQMMKSGPVAAVDYCNLAAMPLIDSLSNASGAEIKRVSLKLRNPLNTPSEFEKQILELWDQISPDKGFVFFEGGKHKYMYPIKVLPLCMNCHGDFNLFPQELQKTLNLKYPQDQATGYNVGDLRGAWVISFDGN